VIPDQRRADHRPGEECAGKHGQRGRGLVPHENVEREDNDEGPGEEAGPE
jgi:hypothetical protein